MINRRTLPLSALRAFESAATHLHLGRAGDALGVTHGAISHQIKLLEHYLDTLLFTRINNRLALTPAGTQLLEAVTEGFNRIIEGAHNLDANQLGGTLIIGCTQTIATSWAVKLICEFQKKYPMIQITVREIEPRQSIIPTDIDIAFCYGLPKTTSESVIKLASPPLFPVCNPSLITGYRSMLKAEDFSKITLLHDGQVSWNSWFEKFDIQLSQRTKSIYFPNTSQALTAARLGYGIALCNSFETQEFIREGQLIRLGKKVIEKENSYFLVTKEKAKVTLGPEIFKEWIIKTLAH